jgi:hypothetical protein
MPVMDLSEDRLYIVESDTDFSIVSVPLGVVAVTRKVGPWTVFSRFADGSGDFEERTYSGKCIMLVRPVAKGRVVLVEVADLVTPDVDRVRRTLNVMGPRPPPEPDPDPDPDPPFPVVPHVRLSVITDSENTSLPVATVLNGLVAWNELLDSGSEYRLYDIATTESEGVKAIGQLNSAAPGIVITDKGTGIIVHRGPLPATFDELKLLVGRLTGG